jgi:hypothetical protein
MLVGVHSTIANMLTSDARVKVGDAIVLCDAGRSTVDLMSYEIMKLNPPEMKELVHGTGKHTLLPMHHISSLIGAKADLLDLRYSTCVSRNGLKISLAKKPFLTCARQIRSVLQ